MSNFIYPVLFDLEKLSKLHAPPALQTFVLLCNTVLHFFFTFAFLFDYEDSSLGKCLVFIYV